ncbi:MAG: hypothetical protein ABSH20_18585 [Tepidisphaeraceae bacterium]
MTTLAADKPTDNPRVILGLFAIIAVVGLAIRLALVDQSLWYDEMVTLLQYVLQPWNVTVSGAYSPNNHVLFSLLAKLCNELTGGSVIALAIRLPSVLAGCAAGILLAMPIRREHPRLALVLALLAVSHPWLVSFSGWARGYALLLCLCIAATQLLFSGRWRWYVLAMTAALYTHPIAILVAVSHGIAILVLRRVPPVSPPAESGTRKNRQQPPVRTPAALLLPWLAAIAVTGVLAVGLYAPFFIGARSYFSQPHPASLSYLQFLGQSIRCVQAGDPLSGVAHLVIPLMVMGTGLCFAWSWVKLRPLIVTFGVASLLGALVPLFVAAAGETRSMLWLIPVYTLSVFGLVSLNRGRVLVAVILPLGFFAMRAHDIRVCPAQPIREIIVDARVIADKRAVVGVYMASAEAQLVYGLDAIAYTLDPQRDLPALRTVETLSPSKPVLVVFYPEYLRRDQPELARYLGEHYQRVRVLPGRISPAEIWEPKAK